MSVNVEIINISDKEIWVGENRTFLIHDNIIHVISAGKQTGEKAKAHRAVCHELATWIDGKVNYLIDLNNCSKNEPEARLIWSQISEEENTNKVALFGIHPVARVIASFVMGITNRNNQRFFRTKEEAILWLFEKQNAGNL